MEIIRNPDPKPEEYLYWVGEGDTIIAGFDDTTETEKFINNYNNLKLWDTPLKDIN